jgi:hypothetical protein
LPLAHTFIAPIINPSSPLSHLAQLRPRRHRHASGRSGLKELWERHQVNDPHQPVTMDQRATWQSHELLVSDGNKLDWLNARHLHRRLDVLADSASSQGSWLVPADAGVFLLTCQSTQLTPCRVLSHRQGAFSFVLGRDPWRRWHFSLCFLANGSAGVLSYSWTGSLHCLCIYLLLDQLVYV